MPYWYEQRGCWFIQNANTTGNENVAIGRVLLADNAGTKILLLARTLLMQILGQLQRCCWIFYPDR